MTPLESFWNREKNSPQELNKFGPMGKFNAPANKAHNVKYGGDNLASGEFLQTDFGRCVLSPVDSLDVNRQKDEHIEYHIRYRSHKLKRL